MKIEPVVLEGQSVRLEPLVEKHRSGFCEAGLQDAALFRWFPRSMSTRAELSEYFDQHLEQQASKAMLPFATVDRASGKIIGSTVFFAISIEHLRLEIGHTFITHDFQRTRINTEVKFLQLQHCFEAMGCNRVELKTDSLNTRSRAAILRIGAKQEGIFRSHMVTSGGRIRDTVYFSVIASEWAETKAKLLEMLKVR